MVQMQNNHTGLHNPDAIFKTSYWKGRWLLDAATCLNVTMNKNYSSRNVLVGLSEAVETVLKLTETAAITTNTNADSPRLSNPTCK
jgi:hypothetical protein